jgi:hypothetical protein
MCIHIVNKTYVESEPTVSSTEKNLEVLELSEVFLEIRPAGLGGFDALDKGIIVDVVLPSGNDGLDISGSLIDVALNVHGETGCLRNGQSEIQGNDSGNSAETDKETPHEIYRAQLLNIRLGENGGLVSSSDDEANQSGSLKCIRVEFHEKCQFN